MSTKSPIASLHSVSKSYSSVHAVKKISFEIHPQETIALLGPNGAGKSTIIKMLTGSLYPEHGEVRINSRPIQEDPTIAKRSIGYLPENTPLYSEMFIREYLEYTASLYRLPSAAAERINYLIRALGLEKELKKPINALSKGYRQRVGIAQAYLPEPALVILDEPFNGLDPNQIIDVRQFIQEEKKRSSLLFSTHILQEAEILSDRVMILREGEKVADAPLHELRQHHLDGFIYLITTEHPLSIEDLHLSVTIRSVQEIHPCQYRVQASKDLSVELTQQIIEKKASLLELKREMPTLESIFANLTIREQKER